MMVIPARGHDEKRLVLRKKGGASCVSFLLGFFAGMPTGVLLAVMTVAFVLSFGPPTARRERDASALDPPSTWNPNKALWSSIARVPAMAPLPASSTVVTHLGVEPEELSPPESTGPEYEYFVQSGGFLDPAEPRKLAGRLAGAGVQAKVVERKDDGQVKSFVRIGPLAGRDYALSLKDDLVRQGCACRVVRVER